MASKMWSKEDHKEDNDSSFVNLNDVMSEQMIAEELKSSDQWSEDDHVAEDWNHVTEESDTCSDAMLARLLQREFDKMHDKNLAREEQHVNQNSKVALSFALFRRQPEVESEDEEDQQEVDLESRDWDSFERSQRLAVKVGAKGFARDVNGELKTKHDLIESARKNALKAMSFELMTGDGGAFDMKLNNHVFNALKVHAMSEGKRSARLHEKKEKSTAEKVLDAKSRIILYKLVNNGTLDRVNGIVATGKESVVIHATGTLNGVPEQEMAVKVFKTTLNEFKNRKLYIASDPVLEKTAKLSKIRPKLTIPLWAEKEMHNLNRMRRAGILCPEVVILRKHVLVMSFIGSNGSPAPTLKEHQWEDENELKRAFEQCVQLMHALYNTCQLVHADLSEYNLLWHEKHVHCIDVSQSVFTTHKMSFRFLHRDCANIHRFFAKKCLKIPSIEELFAKICGKEVPEEAQEVDLLDQMEDYGKSEELLKYNQNEDPFEAMMEKSARERENTC